MHTRCMAKEDGGGGAISHLPRNRNFARDTTIAVGRTTAWRGVAGERCLSDWSGTCQVNHLVSHSSSQFLWLLSALWGGVATDCGMDWTAGGPTETTEGGSNFCGLSSSRAETIRPGG